MENKTREAIRFEGSVQGVGFRYRMSQLARHYDVTGWVRNEYDGRSRQNCRGDGRRSTRSLRALGRIPIFIWTE